MNIKQYEEMVKHPGKFEGENRYVPYFWEVGLDGLYSYKNNGIYYFYVTLDNIDIFPELNGIKIIRLHEREDGFVIEL